MPHPGTVIGPRSLAIGRSPTVTRVASFCTKQMDMRYTDAVEADSTLVKRWIPLRTLSSTQNTHSHSKVTESALRCATLLIAVYGPASGVLCDHQELATRLP